MATQTTHYSLVKPAYEDQADVGVLNGDLDQIDQLIYDANNDVRPVSKGGTGAATLPNAKANLGITSLENTLGGVKFIRKQAGANTDVSFTFTGLCTFVVFVSGYSAEPRGIIFGSCYSNGVVSTTKLNASSSTNITVTAESFKLSIRSTTAINVALMTLVYSGNVS